VSVTAEGAQLARILDGMAGHRVLVVGDLVADEYVYGETRRVSREAPVLILQRVGHRVIPGAAGNAVLNLAALGGVPVPVSVIGSGEVSALLEAELTERGIDTDGIIRDPARTTIRKTRVMAGGHHGQKQQILRIDEEDPAPVSGALAASLAEHALERLDGAAAVLLSDYGYGVIGTDLRERVIARARERGIPVCADSRYALREFRGVTYATPNETEALAAAGADDADEGDEADLPGVAERLRSRLEADFVLLTRGRDGMVVARADGVHEIPIWGSAEAADVTGAGDTVAAASLLGLLAGGDPVAAARIASIAAGLVVQKHGAATTTREEIRHGADWG
jgi:rfaE bifunctional protein kinase chain/domain